MASRRDLDLLVFDILCDNMGSTFNLPCKFDRREGKEGWTTDA